ncbi:MAG: histidine ammonia-lyase [Chloroflexota bacterium]
MGHVTIRGEGLTIGDVVRVARYGETAELAPEAVERVAASRRLVDRFVSEERVVYGITTGFGKFADVVIGGADTRTLQRNLIMSHATGVGDPLPEEAVRAAMLLRVNALAKGFSGIRLETLNLLVAMLNAGVTPVIPEKGSLGASGDLAPLAHMVLVMIGLGEALYRGRRLPGAAALAAAGLQPVELEAKEGLALINGTQIMTAVGTLALHDAEILARSADVIAALTIDALRGIVTAFDPRVQAVRPHPGQQLVAGNLRRLLAGSTLATEQGELRVQDAYVLRCIPQVHGASRDAIGYVRGVVEREINSATDNPLIFPDDEAVISGGNFHGQPVALAMDFLGIAAAELGNIAERRVERLVNPALSGLPAFLARNGGLNSGFMIAQYTAAALVSENKVLAHPASVDSIPSSANQEDHVSMGTIAARKARQMVYNARHVLAIELLCAAQALDLRPERTAAVDRALRPGAGSGALYDRLRADVPALADDRVLHGDIAAAAALIESGAVIDAAERAIGAVD